MKWLIVGWVDTLRQGVDLKVEWVDTLRERGN
mgnify:CR=1 FL=1